MLDARDVIVTKSELLASLNSPEAFILALVRVEEGVAHKPVYVRRFCTRDPGWAEAAVIFHLAELVRLGTDPG